MNNEHSGNGKSKDELLIVEGFPKDRFKNARVHENKEGKEYRDEDMRAMGYVPTTEIADQVGLPKGFERGTPERDARDEYINDLNGGIDSGRIHGKAVYSEGCEKKATKWVRDCDAAKKFVLALREARRRRDEAKTAAPLVEDELPFAEVEMPAHWEAYDAIARAIPQNDPDRRGKILTALLVEILQRLDEIELQVKDCASKRQFGEYSAEVNDALQNIKRETLAEIKPMRLDVSELKGEWCTTPRV